MTQTKRIGDDVDCHQLGVQGMHIYTYMAESSDAPLKALNDSLLEKFGDDIATIVNIANPLLATLRQSILAAYDVKTGETDVTKVRHAIDLANDSLAKALNPCVGGNEDEELAGGLVTVAAARALREPVPTRGAAQTY